MRTHAVLDARTCTAVQCCAPGVTISIDPRPQKLPRGFFGFLPGPLIRPARSEYNDFWAPVDDRREGFAVGLSGSSLGGRQASCRAVGLEERRRAVGFHTALLLSIIDVP